MTTHENDFRNLRHGRLRNENGREGPLFRFFLFSSFSFFFTYLVLNRRAMVAGSEGECERRVILKSGILVGTWKRGARMPTRTQKQNLLRFCFSFSVFYAIPPPVRNRKDPPTVQPVILHLSHCMQCRSICICVRFGLSACMPCSRIACYFYVPATNMDVSSLT